MNELTKFIEYLEKTDIEDFKHPEQIKEYIIGICKSIKKDIIDFHPMMEDTE